jgi:hypothetical protein
VAAHGQACSTREPHDTRADHHTVDFVHVGLIARGQGLVSGLALAKRAASPSVAPIDRERLTCRVAHAKLAVYGPHTNPPR